MHFLLTTLNLAYVMKTPYPEEQENETLAHTQERTKWENDDYICKGHVLNALADSLFDIYQLVEIAKELWDTLEAKYLTENATGKKFLVCHFMKYSMVDNKPVMDQFHEIHHILSQFKKQKMNMDDSIVVSSIIENFHLLGKSLRKVLNTKIKILLSRN